MGTNKMAAHQVSFTPVLYFATLFLRCLSNFLNTKLKNIF